MTAFRSGTRASAFAVALLMLAGATTAFANDTDTALSIARVQVQALTLALQAGTVVQGDADLLRDLGQTRDDLAKAVSRLPRSDAAALGTFDNAWHTLDGDVKQLVEQGRAAGEAIAAADGFRARLPMLSARLDEVSQLVAASSGGTRRQVQLAMRATLLLQWLQRDSVQILSGDDTARDGAGRLERDGLLLQKLLQALLKGDAELDVTAVDRRAQEIIQEALDMWTDLVPLSAKLKGGAESLHAAHQSVDGIRAAALALVAQGDLLAMKLR
jgi:hypothetical protein